MIPGTIHYCWFGRGLMPDLALKCIESWKKYLPNYHIVEWNEDTFDINTNLYVKQAYETKKYAFVTDYVRLHALYSQGGIYMDTDVEVLGPLDGFLVHPAFTGFEQIDFVPTGIMAAQKSSIWIKELMKYYDNRPFILEDGRLDMTTNTRIITGYMLNKGLILNDQYQEFKDLVAIYPHDYFCPKDHGTGRINLTSRSVCIHHFAMSWVNPNKRRLTSFKKKLMGIFGTIAIERIVVFLKLRQIKRCIFK